MYAYMYCVHILHEYVHIKSMYHYVCIYMYVRICMHVHVCMHALQYVCMHYVGKYIASNESRAGVSMWACHFH